MNDPGLELVNSLNPIYSFVEQVPCGVWTSDKILLGSPIGENDGWCLWTHLLGSNAARKHTHLQGQLGPRWRSEDWKATAAETKTVPALMVSTFYLQERNKR